MPTYWWIIHQTHPCWDHWSLAAQGHVTIADYCHAHSASCYAMPLWSCHAGNTPPRLFHSLLAQSWQGAFWQGCLLSVAFGKIVEISISQGSSHCTAIYSRVQCSLVIPNLYLDQPITKSCQPEALPCTSPTVQQLGCVTVFSIDYSRPVAEDCSIFTGLESEIHICLVFRQINNYLIIFRDVFSMRRQDDLESPILIPSKHTTW